MELDLADLNIRATIRPAPGGWRLTLDYPGTGDYPERVRTALADLLLPRQEPLLGEDLALPATGTTPIEVLALSTRVYNLLKRANIHTVEDLGGWNRFDVFNLPGAGIGALAEIEQVLFDLRERQTKNGPASAGTDPGRDTIGKDDDADE